MDLSILCLDARLNPLANEFCKAARETIGWRGTECVVTKFDPTDELKLEPKNPCPLVDSSNGAFRKLVRLFISASYGIISRSRLVKS